MYTEMKRMWGSPLRAGVRRFFLYCVVPVSFDIVSH